VKVAHPELVPPSGYRLAGHKYLGRGPAATGADGGWSLAGHAFRCARCGGYTPAGVVDYFQCRCRALHMDPDYCRLGSQLGDMNILVYRRSVRRPKAAAIARERTRHRTRR
jgi:hypothetical protein